VLLHGLFGDGDNLKGLGMRLGKGLEAAPEKGSAAPQQGAPASGERTVLRPHLPGHGDTPATVPLSFEAMADDLAARIDAALPPGAPLHLIGHSLGGKIAMTLVARRDGFAARVRSLCVLDIGPRRYAPHHLPLIEALQALDLDGLSGRRDADAALAPAIEEPGVRAFLLKGLVRDGEVWRWRFDLAAIARDYATCIAEEVPPAPPTHLPALFLAGERSDYLGDADRSAAREAFPDARIDTVAGTGHWLHAERPDEVAAAVNALLRDVDADR